MMDAAEELKKALAGYMTIRNEPDWAEHSLTHRLVGLVEEQLPAVLTELAQRRAAMGEDITTRTGFSGQATEALK